MSDVATATTQMEVSVDRMDEISRKIDSCLRDANRRLDEADDALRRIGNSLLRMEYAARSSRPPAR